MFAVLPFTNHGMAPAEKRPMPGGRRWRNRISCWNSSWSACSSLVWLAWHDGKSPKKWSFIFGKTSYKILHMWNFPAGHVRLPEGNVSLHPTHWYTVDLENIWLDQVVSDSHAMCRYVQDIFLNICVWYPWLLFAKDHSNFIEHVL